MTAKAVKEALRDDIADWFADGVIEEGTLARLRVRYEHDAFGLGGFVRYLGIAGGLIAFFGFVGMFAAMSGSELVAALVTGGTGAGLTWWGLRLSADLQERFANSSKVVLALGVTIWTTAIGFLCHAVGCSGETTLIVTGVISLPVTGYLAYATRNTWLLIMAVSSLFHWVGAWNAMLGSSSYAFEVQDPVVMGVFSLLAIGVGLYHERHLAAKTGGFHRVWEGLGLLYLNTSLLILSIWSGHDDYGSDDTRIWVAIFSVACIAQMVAGARLHNGLIRGFGIVFLSIDVFTRYHEEFWDRFDLGSYLFGGGVCLLLLGVLQEMVWRRLHAKGALS